MADELNPAKKRAVFPSRSCGRASAEEVLEFPKPKHIRAAKIQRQHAD
jgi:hypothetical protein